MSTYQYQEPSALDKISIRKTAGGGSRAFLFARDGISPGETDKIRACLDNAHFACVPSEINGDHCLEVRGCRDVKALETILRPAGLLQGKAQVDHSDNEKFSLTDRLRNNLVSMYGVLNVLADIGIITYGHMKQKLSPQKAGWEDKAAGYAYSAGSLIFTAFGRGDKSDYQARDIALALRKELQGRGIELSGESAAMSFATQSSRASVSRKASNYLSKYGAEAGNIATGTAGLFMLKGALKNQASGTKAMDGILGATTMLSGYGAALVKEKAPDPEHPPTTAFGRVKQWVQEKPNRLAGYGYMISTGIHGAETVRHFATADKEHPGNAAYARKAYAFRGAFTTLNLISEFMLAAASKGHGAGVRGNNTIEDTALAIVADAIVRQPQAQRETLIHDLGCTFLASPETLGGDPADMQAKLAARVHIMENNPWLITAAGSMPKTVPADESVARGKDTHNWAESKMQKLVSDAAKGKPESHVSSLDKNRAATAERAV